MLCRLVKAAVILGILCLSVFGVYYYYRSSDRELVEAIAELDRKYSGWRLEDVLARRQPIPADQNSVTIVLAAHQHMPKFWHPKVYDDLDFGDVPPPVLLSPRRENALEADLRPLAKARDLARKLPNYPRGRFSVEYTPDYVTTLARFDLYKTHDVSSLLKLDCRACIQKADMAGAWTDCRALLSTARSIGDEPLMVAQLIRIATDTRTTESLERTLAQGEIENSLLAEMQKALAEEAAEPLFRFGVVGELGGMDRYYTEMANGNVDLKQLKLAVEMANAFMGKTTPEPGIRERAEEQFPAAMIKRSHAWTLRKISEAIEADKLKGFEKTKAFKKLEETFEKEQDVIPTLAKHLFRGVYKMASAERRSQTQLSCAIAGLAAERFRIANKRWPKALEELVQARLLEEVPIDLHTGQPLGFRSTGDGLVIFWVGITGNYDGRALDNLRADEPFVQRFEFRLWNVGQRRQPVWPERPRPNLDGPGFGN